MKLWLKQVAAACCRILLHSLNRFLQEDSFYLLCFSSYGRKHKKTMMVIVIDIASASVSASVIASASESAIEIVERACVHR